MLENIDQTILEPFAEREKARRLYESTPATYEEVAADAGVSSRTIKRWSAADGGWTKIYGNEITQRAHEIADQRAAERTEAAVDERATILQRHRSEWRVVRGLAMEAVKDRDYAKARLATEIGKAIDLAQKGERRAWGLDTGEDGGGNSVTVVVERSPV